MVKIAVRPEINLGPLPGTPEGKLVKYTRMLADAKESYRDHFHHFAHLTYLTEREQTELAISYGYLEIIVPHANRADDRNLLFQILLTEKALKTAQPFEHLKVQKDGSLQTKEPNHRIPLTNEEAFRKYVQRAKDKGIVPALVNKGRGEKRPQLSLWTEIMQFLVILYAVCKPTRTSYAEISRDISNLLEDHPELKHKGVSRVADSTIGEFIREQGKALISFAKDHPNDFKRKILGVLRFLPPSSPLVQVGVDGYHVQTVCADDDTQKPIQLVAIVIYDFKTKAVLGLAFGKTENNVIYRRAWQDYFATTGNRLPRQIVMDKFIANNCQKTHNLNLLFDSHGVDITRSSQPNNNGRLERFFGTIQNFYQGSVLSCSYIGSSITSKSDNARPSKSVQINIRKSTFLKGESEMVHLLTHIFKEGYNKKFSVVNGQSPMKLFTDEKSNHVSKISDADVAYATYEAHRCTVVGCGVIIKRDKHLYLYKNRNLEVARKFFRREVDVYVNAEKPTDSVWIFQKGVRKFHFKMMHIEIVHSAHYDRTEADKEFLRAYNKETRELIAAFQAVFEHMEDAVDTILEGVDYKASREAAKIKKEADGAFLQTQIGLTPAKPEPPQAFTNGLSKPWSKKKKIKQTREEILMKKYDLQ